MGWRGLHVEPSAGYAAMLRAARPDEEVVEAAIGAAAGHIDFFWIPETGLSTGDPALAREHAASGFTVKPVQVPCLTLASLFARHGGGVVHWLKIDVEGMEQAVIESWAGSPVRPWVVVVESTKPLTTEPTHAAWEPQLLALGYDFVHFDGLNRFYVSEAHPELKPRFGSGAAAAEAPAAGAASRMGEIAVLRRTLEESEARRHAEARAHREWREAFERGSRAWEEAARGWQAEAESRNRHLAALEARASLAEHEAEALREWVAALRGSTSWRLTAPLRAIGAGLRRKDG
jgi:FkbM family methyltransferase